MFVLTDHYLMDTYYNLPTEALKVPPPEYYIIDTEEEYRRYEITDDGISPRGIPGKGKGLVRADSHEHDEEGFITEDPEMRTSMALKRMKKKRLIERDVVEPFIEGSEKPEVLVVCWGSTREMVREGVRLLQRNDISVLHFSQVYPLPEKGLEMVRSAKKVICVENNITGQMAKLLTAFTGRHDIESVLKFDGRPFSVEKVAGELEEVFG